MPRTLKRRADAISRDQPSESSSDSDSTARHHTQQQSSRRERRRSTSSDDVSRSHSPSDGSEVDRSTSQNQLQAMVKKLVRLALATEYTRQPLRRTDVTAKVLKADNGSSSTRANFRAVFLGAQKVLRVTFGMELVDLPARERTGLNERRKAVSQKNTVTQAPSQQPDGEEGETQGRAGRVKDPVLSAQSWILVSVLPDAYKARPELLIPGRAPDEATDSTYTALYSTIVSLLYLHIPSHSASTATAGRTGPGAGAEDTTEPLSDSKLHRYLKRINLEHFAPLGSDRNGTSTEKLLARMIREGYIEKRRDMSSGEEAVEWVVGPRGKREVGRRGVARLVRGVYGFGVDGAGTGLEVPRPEGGDEEQGEAEEGHTRPRKVKMERDELERRLKRTLGDAVVSTTRSGEADRGVGGREEVVEQDEDDGGGGGRNRRNERTWR